MCSTDGGKYARATLIVALMMRFDYVRHTIIEATIYEHDTNTLHCFCQRCASKKLRLSVDENQGKNVNIFRACNICAKDKTNVGAVRYQILSD